MDNFYSTTGVPESFLHVLLASKIKYYSCYIIYCLDVLKQISILFLNILSSIKLCFTNKQWDWTTVSITLAVWEAFPFFVVRNFWTNKNCNTPQEPRLLAAIFRCSLKTVWFSLYSEITIAKPPQLTPKKLTTLEILILQKMWLPHSGVADFIYLFFDTEARQQFNWDSRSDSYESSTAGWKKFWNIYCGVLSASSPLQAIETISSHGQFPSMGQ